MVFIALQALIKFNLCKVIVGFNLILKGGDMENVLILFYIYLAQKMFKPKII